MQMQMHYEIGKCFRVCEFGIGHTLPFRPTKRYLQFAITAAESE